MRRKVNSGMDFVKQGDWAGLGGLVPGVMGVGYQRAP